MRADLKISRGDELTATIDWCSLTYQYFQFTCIPYFKTNL